MNSNSTPCRARRIVGFFSVLTLLLGFVIARPGRAEPPMTQKEAIEALMDLGSVLLQADEKLPGRPIVAVDFSKQPDFKEDWLKILAGFPQLRLLAASETPLTDAGLRHLKNLRELETLTLTKTKVTDAGLAELRGLKKLRKLDVRGTAVTAKGAATLPGVQVAFGKLPDDKVAFEPTTFTAAKIKKIRQQANAASKVPEKLPGGWSKSTLDPGKLLAFFEPLRLRKGFVLRAYQFMENGNGNGVVWAMPEDAEFPQPKDCPTLDTHLFKAPKPSEALDDVMEAIEGDGSAWSYLAASLLRRQLNEFGAVWHGMRWSTHMVLDATPWPVRPLREGESGWDRPVSGLGEWRWWEPQPNPWAPLVRMEKDRVIVTFYTFSALTKEGIYRHTDTYRIGKYRAKIEEKKIAEGPFGIAF